VNPFIRKHKDIQQFSCDFEERSESYLALGELIKLYLIDGLKRDHIPYTDIQFRIKSFDSFFSKIKRKKYHDSPYEKIRDICGVRVICTFKSDLSRVTDIINELFDAEPPEDKENEAQNRLVGYRGRHQMVRLKSFICSSSKFYSKLDGLWAEIQIRTVAQHSWAEVSHKLNYKDEENVPSEFKEKLAEISSTLSLIDRLYCDLFKEKEELNNRLRSRNRTNFDLSQEVNIDTLITFLEVFYPERAKGDDISLLFDDIIENNISFENIVAFENRIGLNLQIIENELNSLNKHSQVAIVRLIISLFYPMYWNERKEILPLYFDGSKRIEIIEKWQKKLNYEIS